MPEGVKLAKEAVARGDWPVVLADHSDRSGSATWILQQVIEQDLSDVLIATIADRKATEAVRAKGLKAGDPFDMEIGGRADEFGRRAGPRDGHDRRRRRTAWGSTGSASRSARQSSSS